jgi:hypothetical protein
MTLAGQILSQVYRIPGQLARPTRAHIIVMRREGPLNKTCTMCPGQQQECLATGARAAGPFVAAGGAAGGGLGGARAEPHRAHRARQRGRRGLRLGRPAGERLLRACHPAAHCCAWHLQVLLFIRPIWLRQTWGTCCFCRQSKSVVTLIATGMRSSLLGRPRRRLRARPSKGGWYSLALINSFELSHMMTEACGIR